MAGRIIYRGPRAQYISFFQKIRKFLVLGAVLALCISFYFLVRFSAFWLIANDEYDHVDYVLVMDGQGPDMVRSEYALELLEKGKADTIVLSGRRVYRNQFNSEFYRDEMLAMGDYNPSQILTIHHDDASSLEEAKTAIPYFMVRKADTVLVITASMASARVASIFQALTPEEGPVFIATDMEFKDFIQPENWMTFREGKKQWLLEMLKRLYTYWEILGSEPVSLIPGKKYRLFHEPQTVNPEVEIPEPEEEEFEMDLDALLKDSASADSASVSDSSETPEDSIITDSLNQSPKDSTEE